jgi:hypothetical protein
LSDRTILEVWKNALKKGKGVVRDPNTGEILNPPYYKKGKKGKKGKLVYDWHMGHKEGHEWWRLQIVARDQGLTRQQIVDIYNDPSHYRPEDPTENVGHEHESDETWILKSGTIVGR